MTVREFHETIASKVQGTWNLHHASLSQRIPLDFFTLLSSISGVIGQKGQANYAAANAFLDSFASYRHTLSLPALSVDLGAVEDVGYVAENAASLSSAFDKEIWTPINESLLHQILRFSILQQTSPSGNSQMITGIAIPQPPTSPLLKRDPRFSTLYFPSSSSNPLSSSTSSSSETDAAKAIRVFLLSLSSPSPSHQTSLISILQTQFSTALRLSSPMEPAKPLSSYGLDSLSAVEFRNWARMELGAELTTLEIMGASSLVSLAGKILGKIEGKKE